MHKTHPMTPKQPLSVTHPELTKQAVGWDPSLVTSGSSLGKLWKCEFGHEWLATILNRTRGSGCPFCSGRLVSAGVNDLATRQPELAKQAFGWDPSSIHAGSHAKKPWKCSLGHTWLATVGSRTNGNGCPFCAGKQVLAGFNDLATVDGDLANQAFGWDPITVTRSAGVIREWKCNLGHRWKATVNKRSSGKGCPTCAGKVLQIGFNDLATVKPELAREAYEWDPKTVTRGSHSERLWKCKSGHIWKSKINNRVAGSGCPICVGQQVLIGFNDFATTQSLLASEAFGWDPTTVTQGTRVKKEWRCKVGHTWFASVAHRSAGLGCPICSGKKVLVGFNDLATVEPALAAQAFGWDPRTVTRSVGVIREWSCELGHVWKAVVASRASGVKCPYCSGNKVLVGFNDLATVKPELTLQAIGWDPTKVTRGTNSKKDWICEEGHRWSASVSSRSNGIGCPTCSISGFDPNSEGWLYFLAQPQWEMLQIGITNFPDQRLNTHKKLGWELIEIRGPMDGLITREWETSILRMLKRHGAKLGPEEIAGKFDGYTEAWLTESYEAKSLRDLMDAVKNDEG